MAWNKGQISDLKSATIQQQIRRFWGRSLRLPPSIFFTLSSMTVPMPVQILQSWNTLDHEELVFGDPGVFSTYNLPQILNKFTISLQVCYHKLQISVSNHNMLTDPRPAHGRLQHRGIWANRFLGPRSFDSAVDTWRCSNFNTPPRAPTNCVSIGAAPVHPAHHSHDQSMFICSVGPVISKSSGLLHGKYSLQLKE